MPMFNLLFICFILVFQTTTSLAQEDKARVAVLDFASIGCDSSLGLAASEILRTELGSAGRFRIIERSQLLKVMEEQSLHMTGAVDEESVAEIGKLLGAKLVVVGSIVRTGKTYTLNSRFIDVETAEVKKSSNVRGNSEDEISNMCASLAKIISEERVSIDGESGTASNDLLGSLWLVQESEYTGVWIRRGETNVYDGMWFLNSAAIHSELTMSQPAPQSIEIKRVDNGKVLGNYKGVSSMAGRRYRGTVDWSASVAWSAEVFFETTSPAMATNLGAVWLVTEGDYVGIWRRHDNTNNYDASYFLNDDAVTAILTVESFDTGDIQIKRATGTGVLGHYRGDFTSGNRHLSGGADWSEAVSWSAEIFY